MISHVHLNYPFKSFVSSLCPQFLIQYMLFIKIPIAETLRQGNIVTGTENVLQTVFVYINENNRCFH